MNKLYLNLALPGLITIIYYTGGVESSMRFIFYPIITVAVNILFLSLAALASGRLSDLGKPYETLEEMAQSV